MNQTAIEMIVSGITIKGILEGVLFFVTWLMATIWIISRNIDRIDNKVSDKEMRKDIKYGYLGYGFLTLLLGMCLCSVIIGYQAKNFTQKYEGFIRAKEVEYSVAADELREQRDHFIESYEEISRSLEEHGYYANRSADYENSDDNTSNSN